MNIRGGLEKLEASKGNGLLVMWPTETDEQAKERWHREHPGEDPNLVLQIVLVAPKPRPAED